MVMAVMMMMMIMLVTVEAKKCLRFTISIALNGARSFATFRFFKNPISQPYNISTNAIWFGLVRCVRFSFPHISFSSFPMLFSFSFNFLLLSNIKKMDMDVARECVTMWHA